MQKPAERVSLRGFEANNDHVKSIRIKALEDKIKLIQDEVANHEFDRAPDLPRLKKELQELKAESSSSAAPAAAPAAGAAPAAAAPAATSVEANEIAGEVTPRVFEAAVDKVASIISEKAPVASPSSATQAAAKTSVPVQPADQATAPGGAQSATTLPSRATATPAAAPALAAQPAAAPALASEMPASLLMPAAPEAGKSLSNRPNMHKLPAKEEEETSKLTAAASALPTGAAAPAAARTSDPEDIAADVHAFINSPASAPPPKDDTPKNDDPRLAGWFARQSTQSAKEPPGASAGAKMYAAAPEILLRTQAASEAAKVPAPALAGGLQQRAPSPLVQAAQSSLAAPRPSSASSKAAGQNLLQQAGSFLGFGKRSTSSTGYGELLDGGEGDDGKAAAAAPPSHGGVQKFKVVMAMSGTEVVTVEMQRTPPPKIRDLKQKLREKGHTGKLMVLHHSIPMAHILADHEEIPLDDSGITHVSLIKNQCIQVKEAGYYNGIYEAVDDNESQGMNMPSRTYKLDRPVFKMQTPDHPKAGKDRFIIYTTGPRVPEGWKCVRNARDHGCWDLLRNSRADDDMPYGKWTLNNGGTEPKPNAPNVTPVKEDMRTKAEKQRDIRLAESQQDGNDSHDVCAGCFNGEAKVKMSDGSWKQAQDITVGDVVASREGMCTCVEAVVVEAKSHQRLVKLGDLLITFHHPIVVNGQWVQPSVAEGACLVDANIRLYNLVTTNRDPIIVEGFMATSVGTYCEGMHDMSNPEHQVWGTDMIVNIYRQHPQWPNIVATSEETIMAVARAVSGAPHPIWQYAQGCAEVCLEGEHKEIQTHLVACR